jgi:hypothetical protein
MGVSTRSIEWQNPCLNGATWVGSPVIGQVVRLSDAITMLTPTATSTSSVTLPLPTQ